jgi:1-acyl-sn-glycerol-3-phosphate acyltransferase
MEVGKPTAEPAKLWRQPLPEMAGRPGRRVCCRSLALLGRSWLKAAPGWEHALPANDPFILAPNHGSRLEALLLPALLALHRQGRQVHFLADWNYFLWPLLGSLMRMNDPVIITRKPARPRFLNVFKPRFQSAETSYQQARRRLLAGQSLGIFPEGTVNRRTQCLLPGRTGVARLSLETGAAVIPAGIQWAGRPSLGLNLDAVVVRMGRPLWPDTAHLGTQVPAPAVRQWHETIMRAIADLSGKSWPPPNPENNYATAHSSPAN